MQIGDRTTDASFSYFRCFLNGDGDSVGAAAAVEKQHLQQVQGAAGTAANLYEM